MKPQEFKRIRESFGLTQSEFALCLGLTQKTISQYEMGFRTPGPTVKVVVKTLDRVKENQLSYLLELMKDVSTEINGSSEKRGSK